VEEVGSNDGDSVIVKFIGTLQRLNENEVDAESPRRTARANSRYNDGAASRPDNQSQKSFLEQSLDYQGALPN
jgi:hypothetical protein